MKKFSIILFDRREKTYAIVGTNYLETEKEHEVKSLKEQSLPAFAIDQGTKNFTESDVESEVNRITNGSVSRVAL